jgi:hypothetical protein
MMAMANEHVRQFMLNSEDVVILSVITTHLLSYKLLILKTYIETRWRGISHIQ